MTRNKNIINFRERFISIGKKKENTSAKYKNYTNNREICSTLYIIITGLLITDCSFHVFIN